jgi:hypothetical protein
VNLVSDGTCGVGAVDKASELYGGCDERARGITICHTGDPEIAHAFEIICNASARQSAWRIKEMSRCLITSDSNSKLTVLKKPDPDRQRIKHVIAPECIFPQPLGPGESQDPCSFLPSSSSSTPNLCSNKSQRLWANQRPRVPTPNR